MVGILDSHDVDTSRTTSANEQKLKRNQTRKNEGDDHDDDGSQGAGGSGNDSDCLVEYSWVC